MSSEFYLRYYVGHKGKFGHEFLEFEFRPDGKFLEIIKIMSDVELRWCGGGYRQVYWRWD